MTVVLSLAKPGSTVRKGDVVAEFDRQYMLLRLDDYKASVFQADADLRKVRADLAVRTESLMQRVRVAKADLDKARLDLRTIEVVSDMDAVRLKLAAEEAEARYQQLQQEVELSKAANTADLRSSEIEFEQAKLELKRAENNANRMLVKAPMDGLVVMQSIRRGMEQAQVQEGDQLYPGQIFMQIVDPSSMVVNANVNQVDSESLRIGQPANVNLDAFPAIRLSGKVYSIGAVPVAGRRANFMKTIPVRVKLDGQDNRVIPDLSAYADVVVAAERGKALIPAASLFRDGEQGKAFVYLRGPDAWLRREVEVGATDSQRVVVKSGLKNGDVVSTAPPAKPGDKDKPST
ncbi:MAG: efflux RND transporter periplasmic adaptor subunit [Bryobacteraceae bacterium]